jgi:hypothetical protein
MPFPDLNLIGLKPVYQLGFDRHFGYQAQPLREMVFSQRRKWKMMR